jgi:hypothetical protein
MKIKAEDVFTYILGISRAIVSQNSEITPEQATKRALETFLRAQQCTEAWVETHDENGNFKDPFGLLQSLGKKLSPQSIEKLGDMIAEGFGVKHDV